jgi:DNA repair protein RecN (Recombination protein N)
LLCELRVKNLGIIEDISWRLRYGLNVITGETGAGKSLLIDALELLLTGKADEEVIRQGANEAQIEGVFKLNQTAASQFLKELLTQKGMNEDDDTLLISCQLRKNGSGVSRVNGHAVTKSFLHQIGRSLVDVNGQNEHFSLLDDKSQLEILDAYANTVNLRNEFTFKAEELHKKKHELLNLEQSEKDRTQREEFLKFQLSELNQAQLRDGEEEELEQKKRVLTSIETLKNYSFEVYQALYEDDGSMDSIPIIDKLSAASKTLKKLVDLDPSLKEQLKFIEDAITGLSEIARDIRSYNEGLNYDRDNLEKIDSRLELIRQLKRKYGDTIAEVLAYQNKTAEDLDGLTHNTERMTQLVKEIGLLRHESGRIAHRLSQERSKAAVRLKTNVKKELDDLNMSQVKFEVSISKIRDEEGIPFPDGNCYSFNERGTDSVEFMASTNPGEAMKPLISIASTGELSRFTLALKSALAETDTVRVLIFDEIDIGVGGRSGEILGKKLWNLGRQHQVISITHLPQIAVFADAHFGVHKEISGDRTLTRLQNLDGDSRIKELTVMLSGPEYTAVSMKNAKELMQKADSWKKSRQKGS